MTGRGTLFLIVGASGVGKDSLIDAARETLAGDSRFAFPRRTITRAADAGGEAHDAVSAEAFSEADREGAFCLSWHAHGLSYGIPAGCRAALAAGRSVVVNVSRSVIDKARRELAPVSVVVVTATAETIRARLVSRGREIGEDIEARIRRGAEFKTEGADVVTIANDGTLERGVAAFIDVLRRHAGAAAPVTQAHMT